MVCAHRTRAQDAAHLTDGRVKTRMLNETGPSSLLVDAKSPRDHYHERQARSDQFSDRIEHVDIKQDHVVSMGRSAWTCIIVNGVLKRACGMS